MHSLKNKSELKSSKRKPWPDNSPHNIVIIWCSVVIVVVCIGGNVVVVVIVHRDNIVEVDVNLSIAPVDDIPDLGLLEYHWQLVVMEKVDHGMLKINRF